MPRWVRAPRPIAFVVVALVYFFALGAAALAWRLFSGADLVWQLGASSLAATLAVFVASVALDNSSAFDPYWSVAPIAAALWLVVRAPHANARAWIAVALTIAWGARLTWNWARGWRGLGQEDFRYVDLRAQNGRAYWLVSLFGIHLFPALLVWLGSWSLVLAIRSRVPLGWLDGAGTAVAIFAIALEAIADRELRAFLTSPHDPDAICARGPWAWSRHPNYLGEIWFWWGLALLALGGDRSALWCVSGPVAITLLFNAVSIPLMEKHMAAKRPDYEAHCQRVSRLLPWPRRFR
jgi:steroid 5-alpha reductase family enzyme